MFTCQQNWLSEFEDGIEVTFEEEKETVTLAFPEELKVKALSLS